MDRRRASGSGSAAARVRAHSSRSSVNDEVCAFSSNRDSAPGSTVAAAATAAACWAESRPDRAAVATAGNCDSRRAVSMASITWPTDVPVVRARWWAVERSPASFHAPASAQRTAARPLTVAAMRSMAPANSTTVEASAPLNSDGSKVAAQQRIDARSSTRVSHMPEAIPRRDRTWEGNSFSSNVCSQPSKGGRRGQGKVLRAGCPQGATRRSSRAVPARPRAGRGCR